MNNPMTDPIINKVNAIIGGIVAILSYILGENWYLFLAFLVANIGDFISRWIAARITGKESSKKCSVGIIKKLGYWLMIAVAFGMSSVFIGMGKTIGVDLHVTTLLGWFVLAALFINEIRSILENLVDAGYKVPKVLVKGLEVANKTLNVAAKISDDEEEKWDGA